MGSLCSCFDEEVEEEVIEDVSLEPPCLKTPDLKTSHCYSRSDFNFVTLQSPPKEAAAEEWKVPKFQRLHANYNGGTTPPKKPVYNHMTTVTPPKPVVPLPTLLKASREAPAKKTSAQERLGEDASGTRVTCSKETKAAAVDSAIKSLRECIERGNDFMKKAQVMEDHLDDLLRRMDEMRREKMKDPRRAGHMTLSRAFQILEVPMGCQDFNRMRKAWQSMCLKYHPDKQPADLDAEAAATWTAKFRDGMEAFQVVQEFMQPQ